MSKDDENLAWSKDILYLEGLFFLSQNVIEKNDDLEVPVIITSQLKRELETRLNKRPMLSDIRDSEVIENKADLIAFIYRDEYYNPETEDRGITEIIVTKQSNGPVGTVKLLFEPQYTRFRNLAI